MTGKHIVLDIFLYFLLVCVALWLTAVIWGVVEGKTFIDLVSGWFSGGTTSGAGAASAATTLVTGSESAATVSPLK